jgi:hypothetical protein
VSVIAQCEDLLQVEVARFRQAPSCAPHGEEFLLFWRIGEFGLTRSICISIMDATTSRPLSL